MVDVQSRRESSFRELQLDTTYTKHTYSVLAAENIDGGTLPESFEPFFESSTALVQGKYFLSPRGKTLDMTTMKLANNVERNEDFWANIETIFYARQSTEVESGHFAVTCRMSELTVKSHTFFIIRQESHNLLVIEQEGNTQGVFLVQNPLQNGSTFLFDCEDSRCVFFPNYKSSYRLAMTPDGKDVICVNYLSSSHVDLLYYEVSRDSLVRLAHFSRPNNEDIKAIVFFAGMMFLKVDDSALVPLWIDLEGLQDRNYAFQGNKYAWRSVLIRPRYIVFTNNAPRSFQIIRSKDKRWATNWLGRQVCDLWRFKTFIVKDKGVHTCRNCKKPDYYHSLAATVFTGKRDEDTPEFYTISRPLLDTLDSFLYGRRSRENGFPKGLVNKDPTNFWKKVLQEHHKNPHSAMALFSTDRQRAWVNDQSEISDLLEDPVGLAWLDQW